MALVGPWGCYIHIPKTAGQYTKKVLWNIEPGKSDGDRHGFPWLWDYDRIFAVVRDPCDWLNSVYAHRVREKWSDPPYPARVPWTVFCQMTDRYRGTCFDEYVWNICKFAPGVVGWMFADYMTPLVQPVRYWELDSFLISIGGKPVDPINIGENKEPITEAQRRMIKKTEKYMYDRWRL